MTTYRVTILFDLDDEALAEHPGRTETPPNDIEDWIAQDLLAAIERGIVDESSLGLEGAFEAVES